MALIHDISCVIIIIGRHCYMVSCCSIWWSLSLSLLCGGERISRLCESCRNKMKAKWNNDQCCITSKNVYRYMKICYLLPVNYFYNCSHEGSCHVCFTTLGMTDHKEHKSQGILLLLTVFTFCLGICVC